MYVLYAGTHNGQLFVFHIFKTGFELHNSKFPFGIGINCYVVGLVFLQLIWLTSKIVKAESLIILIIVILI
jgi:hypothetical protein